MSEIPKNNSPPAPNTAKQSPSPRESQDAIAFQEVTHYLDMRQLPIYIDKDGYERKRSLTPYNFACALRHCVTFLETNTSAETLSRDDYHAWRERARSIYDQWRQFSRKEDGTHSLLVEKLMQRLENLTRGNPHVVGTFKRDQVSDVELQQRQALLQTLSQPIATGIHPEPSEVNDVEVQQRQAMLKALSEPITGIHPES